MKEEKQTEKIQSNRQIRGSVLLVAAFLLVGSVMAFVRTLSGTGVKISAITLLAAAVIGVICCEAAWNISRVRRAGYVFAGVPWLAGLIVTGFHGYFAGMKAWINGIIHNWNQLHEGGISLFGGSMTEHDVWAFTIMAGILLGELAWWLAAGRRKSFCWIFGMIWTVLMVLSGEFRALECGLLFGGLFGKCVMEKEKQITRTGLRWLAIIAVCCVGVAFLTSNEDLSGVADFRERVKVKVHDMRYGQEKLPAGDLGKASEFQKDTDKMLRVTSAQEKNLYLKAFVGGIYRNGRWDTMPDSAYGGDDAGMLDWLKEKNFDPLTQVSDYYRLGGKEKLSENDVKIQVSSASRDYFYTTGTLQKVTEGKYKEKKDYAVSTKGLFGERTYQFQELSGSKPAELTVAADWVQHPSTKKQKTYSEAESVYRAYVYDHYTTVDDKTYQTVNDIFWKDYRTKNDGIYSALTQIRKKLSEGYTYTLQPYTGGQEDPLDSFLNESHSGNAMLYASAAVEAFRAHGIPARYVEGYYLSDNQIAQSGDGHALLSGEDMHAWAEVYFDGVGWLPVDVTPGYYYDAAELQNMVNTPDKVQKNAALKDNSFKGKKLSDSGSRKEKIKEKIKEGARDIAMLLLGVCAVFIILGALTGVVLELGEIIGKWKFRRKYAGAAGAEQVRLLGKEIYVILNCLGLDAYLGWNTKETDSRLEEQFAEIENGEYTRVCGLLEKQIYGDIPLERYEVRTLTRFREKLLQGAKNAGAVIRLKLHFRHLEELVRETTDS